MTAQMAISTLSSAAMGAVEARTAWMAGQDTQGPLRTAGTVVQVAQGREIFAEGDDTDLFYKVVSGVVRACKFLNDGRRQIEAFHVAGDLFGLELDEERLMSAEAVSDCTLVCYRRRSVETLAQKDQAVSRQLFQYAMQNMASAQAHSLLLGRRGAVEKVAAFLLGWAKQSASKRILHLAMTRQDIADYLGLTIETVSRSLTQLERDNVIALPSTREVRILNSDILEDLAA